MGAQFSAEFVPDSSAASDFYNPAEAANLALPAVGEVVKSIRCHSGNCCAACGQPCGGSCGRMQFGDTLAPKNVIDVDDMTGRAVQLGIVGLAGLSHR